MARVLRHIGRWLRLIARGACAIGARSAVGAIAALPLAAGSLALAAWLRWRAFPIRTVALEVASSSGSLLPSLVPAAAIGACGPRALGRRMLLGGLTAILTVVPSISLSADRSVAEVLAAATARPLDFSMILASHAAGCAAAAAVAGAARRGRCAG